MHIPAKLLAKAAVCVSKDPTRKHLHYIIVSSQKMEATNGIIAFRAPLKEPVDGYYLLRPVKKLPLAAKAVILGDGEEHRVLMRKGADLPLATYFAVSHSADKPSFPDFDKIFDSEREGDGAWAVDLQLLLELMAGESRKAQIGVRIEQHGPHFIITFGDTDTPWKAMVAGMRA